MSYVRRERKPRATGVCLAGDGAARVEVEGGPLPATASGRRSLSAKVGRQSKQRWLS